MGIFAHIACSRAPGCAPLIGRLAGRSGPRDGVEHIVVLAWIRAVVVIEARPIAFWIHRRPATPERTRLPNVRRRRGINSRQTEGLVRFEPARALRPWKPLVNTRNRNHVLCSGERQ